jgi:NAD(P)-dependent dehydrogenase (short-subunit alcohol dehydrogenase family)
MTSDRHIVPYKLTAMMPTILITGATRGLGLGAARCARDRATVLVSGRDRIRTERAAAELGAEPFVLDLDSLADVHAAVDALPHLDVVVCNAGLQIPGAERITKDGFEETFQVNFLSHLALVDGLLERERPPARVLWVGSGTHDPAQHSGMPAPREDDLEAIAHGDMGSGENAGRRRYTTSKLLTTAVTGGLARERPDLYVACLDPGLMTATGLAREYPAPVARVYMSLGRAIALLPFASTPERSGAQLAALALDDPPPAPSGTTINSRGKPARISDRARDAAFQNEVLAAARSLLRSRESG